MLEEIEAQVREHYGLNKKNDETAETEPAAEEKPKKTRKTKAAPKEEESIEFTEEDMADMGRLRAMTSLTKRSCPMTTTFL